MSNVLRVTTPTTGYDNMNYPKTDTATKPDAQIQGPVVPDKVVRPDARSDAGSQQELGMKFQYQSNFEGFAAQIRAGGSVVEEFAPILFERLANAVKAGIGEGTATELSGFLKMIQMEPQDVLAFMKSQGDMAIRFQGAFFSLLRQALGETRSVELRAGILDFIKRYTDMAEGQHLLEEIRQTLGEIRQGMFQSGQKRLEVFEQQLNYNAEPGQTGSNASVIKEQILPYLNQYIGSTHDRGLVRENSALLAALTARYENGEGSRVVEKFKELMESPVMQKYFKGLKPEGLLKALATTDYEKAVAKNQWMSKFADLIRDGMTKGADLEQKQVFRNVMQSIVLNESVYMPVLHMMLPMQVDGRMTFAEMWVDPDAKKNSSGDDDEKRVIQGLVKFDIEGVGFFDLFFVYQDKKVNIQLGYPDGLKDKEGEIRQRIAQILVENGLESQELYLGSSQNSIAVSEAFPQIFERKNSINVKI